jgi:hypothetical protein
MKILVRFPGDNDFGLVMLAFGDLLYKCVKESERVGEGHILTADLISSWFNHISGTLYEMIQNPMAVLKMPAERESTHLYLQISHEDVYINHACEEKLKTAHQWSNYDSVVVDTADYLEDFPNRQVYSI